MFEWFHRYQSLLLLTRQLSGVVLDSLQQPFRARLPGIRVVVASTERGERSEVGFRLVSGEDREDVCDHGGIGRRPGKVGFVLREESERRCVRSVEVDVVNEGNTTTLENEAAHVKKGSPERFCLQLLSFRHPQRLTVQ